MANTVEAAPRRWRRLGSSVAMVALVVVVLGGAATLGSYLVWRSRQPGRAVWCAGVGLAGPSAPTRTGALDAWLAETPQQPPSGRWRATGSETFTNRTYDQPRGYGFRSVEVVRGGVDTLTDQSVPANRWHVDGACV